MGRQTKVMGFVECVRNPAILTKHRHLRVYCDVEGFAYAQKGVILSMELVYIKMCMRLGH
jgi:hypothetical protein